MIRFGLCGFGQDDAAPRYRELIKALELKNGMVVADIGAGSGYFARRLAKAVAPKGTVYAVDISENILGYLREEAGFKLVQEFTFIRADRSSYLLFTLTKAHMKEVFHLPSYPGTLHFNTLTSGRWLALGFGGRYMRECAAL